MRLGTVAGRETRERYVMVVDDRNLPRPITLRFLFAPATRRLLRLLPPTPPCPISILPDEVTRHRARGRLYLCQVTTRCCVRPVHSVPRAVVLYRILHPVHAPTHFSPIQIATPSLPTSHWLLQTPVKTPATSSLLCQPPHTSRKLAPPVYTVAPIGPSQGEQPESLLVTQY